MRLLVPAASAALIAALALSASAAVPVSGTRPDQALPQGPAVPSTPDATGRAATGGAKPADPDRAAAHTARGASRGDFAWPLSPRPAVLRPFEQPENQWSHGHRGVDLLSAVGQPVLSAGEGVVAFSGVIAGRGVLTVRHSGGLRTTYGPVEERLASGVAVHRGDRIGVVSPAPGHCAPLICLHWGAIADQTPQRNYRDPLSLLGFGQPILLPLG